MPCISLPPAGLLRLRDKRSLRAETSDQALSTLSGDFLMPYANLDLHHGPRLDAADLLELYRRREATHPLLLEAAEVAAGLEVPGPELPWPFKERRDAIYDALYRGLMADAEALAAGWVEAALVQARGGEALELVAAIEAYSTLFEARGELSETASALAIALRLHARRSRLPFHGTLLRRAVRLLGSLGGLDAARLLASEALRLAIETDDQNGAAYSLGAAYRMASLARDWPAVLASVAAAKRFLSEGEPLLRFSLLQGEANAFAELGHFEAAETALDAAAAALAGHESPLTESYLLWSQARLHQTRGKHEEAARAFRRCAEQGAGTQEPENRMLVLLDFSTSLEALGLEGELRERCAALLRDLPPISSLEGAPSIGEAFIALCRRLGEAI